MDSGKVIRATKAETDEVIELFSQSLGGIEVAHWLVPDPVERERVFRPVTRIYVEHALEYGYIDLTEDRHAAVAYYLDQDAPPPHDFEERVRAAAGPYAERFLAFARLVDENHPLDVPPHAYAAILGRRPGMDGQRIGYILRDHLHRIFDEADLPCYFEVSSDRLRQSLLRRGSRDIGHPFCLPDGGPVMFPMWMEPNVPDRSR